MWILISAIALGAGAAGVVGGEGVSPAARAPGFVPAVPHPRVEPLMPQRYRTARAGKYPCSINIAVSKEGKVTDITPSACDDETLWALATAVVQWSFDPATQDGQPVDSVLEYTNVFEVKTLLPRKHIVGFVGAVANVGGTGWAGLEGRIHLGEILSMSGGVDIDRDATEVGNVEIWTPVFRGDLTLSSRRRHHEHRGIYGFTAGGYADANGAAGMYAGFRGELMTPVPGLSFGGDAGLAFMFTDPATVDDVGFWVRDGINPVYPWLRASLIWYAPLPADQFVVVPREQDPTVYEPIIVEPEPLPDLDGEPFPGIRSVHWSEIEPSEGESVVGDESFGNWPPGNHRCNVRVQVGPAGLPERVRAERCPSQGRALAERVIGEWRWPKDLVKSSVQAVFPAPIFVRREDADLVPAVEVWLLEDGKPKEIPRRVSQPQAWVHQYIVPEWTSVTPTGSCMVDVDLDATGKVINRRWVSGEIEVSGRVWDALDEWRWYPVPVDGELRPVRIRVSMCDA